MNFDLESGIEFAIWSIPVYFILMFLGCILFILSIQAIKLALWFTDKREGSPKASSATIVDCGIEWKEDPEADISYLEQDGCEDRLQACLDGEFYFLGCYAWASVNLGGTIQRIQSGGLWGIESDSEKGFIFRVEKEQISELRTILRGMGVKNCEMLDSQV